jgi:small subunit ribosomal protein S18
MADNSEIRYLNPIDIEDKKEKYCRFKKSGIKFIDYKDPDFLMKFINEQGKLLTKKNYWNFCKISKKSISSSKKSKTSCYTTLFS